MLAAFGYAVNYSPNIFIEPVILRQSICILQQCARLAIELPVRFEYLLLLFVIKTGSVQASLINTPNPRWIMSTDSQKRRNIPSNPSQSRHERPLTYGNKLMCPSQTAEPNTGLNLAVTPYLHKVTHDNLIFKYAIVSNVSTDHNEIIVSIFRYCARTNTGMDCYLFVNDVSITHYNPAEFVT